jgi:tetratricopeptide (TPR) repeat protein
VKADQNQFSFAHTASKKAIFRHFMNGMTLSRFLLCIAGAILIAPFSATGSSFVRISEEDVVIPTYAAGEPERNPMFYFGRQSQGAEGRIYPYPLYDTLTGVKSDKTYKMVYLENEYVKIGILPEIGGRIFSGVDKSNNYDFFYRQHVIKPALIGLIGAWISGGVEWNIPHHHRASTFLPVQYRIESNKDGSKTVWVGELEVRHRMRWALGYTLRPGKSYLEASIRIVNRTPELQSMLCFANVAVSVNEHYQVIFPPGTQYVTHHHKRDFTTWPIATTSYGGYDFSRGVDVSWFTNHLAANSMFAWNYEDDFFAGYDHGKQAGLMSVADHHIVPGKKLWTWGNGPRGRMWDKILTDEDGPYIELMVGGYSDNQPDYSWLEPYEVKSFEMYWYPFRDIGGVKKANLDAAVNLDVAKDGAVKVGFFTTAAHREAEVVITAGNKTLLREKTSLNPARAYLKQISIPAGVDEHDVRASLLADGRELVSYSPIRLKPEPMPKPVKDYPAPEKIATNEELYLTGLRIEQFHNASFEPDPCWAEALRRDPGDTQVNTAWGILQLKRMRFAEAESMFRKALERLTDKYTMPRNAEPYYYLGVALKAQGRLDEAFAAFYKATWSASWRAGGYYSLAEIACGRNQMAEALQYVDRSLEANAQNIRAINLKAAILRHLGRNKEALALLNSTAHRTDPLDVRAMAERWLAAPAAQSARDMVAAMRENPATAAETAAEYFDAGLWKDGGAVLEQLIKGTPKEGSISPMVYYYLACFADKMGQNDNSTGYSRLAAQMSPDYVFPFQSEAIAVLEGAMKRNPADARAPYYLGNLLFDSQPAEAVLLWEKSVALDPAFPIALRNLAIAWSHQAKGNDLNKAIHYMEQAVSQAQKYPIHFCELDELYEAAGAAPEKRMAMLEKNMNIVVGRDDALSRAISLKVFTGQYDDAIRFMTGRQFNVWEGGTLNVASDWTDAHLLRGRQQLAAGHAREALSDFEAAGRIPDNLPNDAEGPGRLAETAYWIGMACETMGDKERARQSWQQSADAVGHRGGSNAMTGRGVQGYYAALSLRKLGGEDEKAQTVFQGLVKSGEEALRQAPAQIDSSAAFNVQQFQRSRLAMAHYITGLGYLGLGEKARAKEELEKAIQICPAHLGAKTAMAEIK